jgi:hypothetical protein
MGHEKYFNTKHHIYSADTDTAFGDSSWLAVPFLRDLPESTTVFHQTRKPTDVLDSLYGRPFVLTADPRKTPFQRFVRRHFPLFNLEEPDKVRLVNFYEYWIAQAEQCASFTYDVSELQDPAFVQDLLKRGFNKELPLPLIREKLATISTKVNGGKTTLRHHWTLKGH